MWIEYVGILPKGASLRWSHILKCFFFISNVVYQKTQKAVSDTMGIGRQAHK